MHADGAKGNGLYKLGVSAAATLPCSYRKEGTGACETAGHSFPLSRFSPLARKEHHHFALFETVFGHTGSERVTSISEYAED